MLTPGQMVHVRLCDQLSGHSKDSKLRRAIVLSVEGQRLCVVIAGTTKPQDAIAIVEQGSVTARLCGLSKTTYFPADLVLEFSIDKVTPLPERCPGRFLEKLKEQATMGAARSYATSGKLPRHQPGPDPVEQKAKDRKGG